METAKDTAPMLVKAIEKATPEEPELCTRLEASYDEVVRVYSVDSTGAPIVNFEHSDRVRAVAVLRDDIVVSASVDGLVRTWHASSGKLVSILNMDIDVDEAIAPTCITKLDERRFVIGSAPGVLFVVSHESGAALSVEKRITRAHSKWISAIAVHSNVMYTCSLDETIKLWDVESLDEIQALHLGTPLTSLAVDESRIVAGSSNGAIHVRSAIAPYPAESNIETYESDIRSLLMISHDLICFTAPGRFSFISLSSNTRISISHLNSYPLTSAAILRGGRIALGGECGVAAIASSPSSTFESIADYSTRSHPKALKHSPHI